MYSSVNTILCNRWIFRSIYYCASAQATAKPRLCSYTVKTTASNTRHTNIVTCSQLETHNETFNESVKTLTAHKTLQVNKTNGCDLVMLHSLLYIIKYTEYSNNNIIYRTRKDRLRNANFRGIMINAMMLNTDSPAERN